MQKSRSSFCSFFKRQKADRQRSETGQRGSAAKPELRKQWKWAVCISACGCVGVFVDARELGKSRGRTNHSVAGIHYYRREHVPKSTLHSPAFLSTSLRFTSESSGTFSFLFFFSQSWTDLGIFYGPFTVRAAQRRVMKKSLGCSHTQARIYFPA